MKKLFLILLTNFFILGLINAQSRHLSFKNIPISGNINQFVEKLKLEGFKLTEMKGDVAIMSGSFVNNSCELYVIASSKTNIVWKVVIYLPKDEDWGSLKRDYFNYKEQYSKKYGVPGDTFEFFSTPYYEGDGYEIQALRKKKCTYSSYWDIADGKILMEISEYSQVSFTYEDTENAKIARKERNSNIQDDI